MTSPSQVKPLARQGSPRTTPTAPGASINGAVPGTVGVVGGGRMGCGIAHGFALAGANVVVVEVDVAAAERTQGTIRQLLERSAQRGKEVDPAAAMTLVTVTTSPAALAGANLVIEAVPEQAQLKRTTLAKVEAAAPAAVLASNTSSIAIDHLAAALTNPSRLIGLHFFNPVPASQLVEVVVGPRTSPDLVPQALSWVAGLGKVPIQVGDSPGFASSRLGVVIALEAMRMVEEGVASPDDIDQAMVLGYRHPVGPLRTTDLVGLDVRLGIAEHLASTLSARFTPPQVLRDLVAAGHLGRKTGQGFFQW